MASMGKLQAKALTLGATGNYNVWGNGVATYPLGNPTFDANQVYPDLGSTTWTTTTGVGIESNNTPQEALSKVETWLDAYLLDAPPLLTSGTSSTAAGYLLMSWSLPTQRKLAFASTWVPQISRLKADIVPSSNNASHDWSSSNAWTVTLETIGNSTPSCSSLKILLDYNAGTSALSSGLYSFYGTSTANRITATKEYDVRVYAENEATLSGQKSKRYLTFSNLATLSAGPPDAPGNVVISSITTTTASANWDDIPSSSRDVYTGAFAYISQYQVNVTANSSGRYGGVLTTHTTPQTTTLTSGSDSTSALTLTTLNPGTLYKITVQAKNALNTSYGNASGASSFTTSNPTAPSWASSSGLSWSNSGSLTYGSGSTGYTLDGNTSRTPIFSYPLISSTAPKTSTLTSVRINANVSDTSTATGLIEGYAGNTSAEVASSFATVGFGQSFTTPVSNTVTSSKLTVAGEGDYYTGGSAGFWKYANVYLEASNASTYYRSIDSSYSLYLKFTPYGNSSVTTNSLTFYVDELSSTPSVIQAGISSVSGGVSYVTGVPTLSTTSNVAFRTSISSLAYRFLRSDKKHFDAAIQTSSGTACSSTLSVTKSSIDGSTHFYYDAPSTSYAVSTSKHNTTGTQLSVASGNIQFNTFTTTLASASSTYNEALRLQVTPYNLSGSGSATTASGVVSTSDGTSKSLRIDTASTSTLSSMSGSVMTTGTDQYPTTGYTSSFDHTATIVGTDQLQMINGRWVSPSYAGYSNYSSYYFPGAVTGPDYSSITSSSGWKYVCLKFTSLKTSGTYDSVTLTFSSSGLTLDTSTDTANFRAVMKVVDSSTTYWVSLTNAINVSGYDGINADGGGVMDNSSSSVGSIKAYVPTGTSASSTVYVRVGLDSSVSQYISGIGLVAN